MSGSAVASRLPVLANLKPKALGHHSKARPAQPGRIRNQLGVFDRLPMIRSRITNLRFRCLACALRDAHAQDATKTRAESHDFPRYAKRLIEHADAVGVT